MNANNENIYINTPFDEKDIVKALGARWDITRKQWYVLPDANLKLFEKWLPASQVELTREPKIGVTEPGLNAKISKIQPSNATLCSEKGFSLGAKCRAVSSRTSG